MPGERTKESRQGAGVLPRAAAPAILVVDDNADMRGYLRRCLRLVAARVVEAADGGEALEIVRSAGPGAFDLIIADVVMPGLDGLALRRALLAEPGLGAPTVLLVTGESVGPAHEPVLRKPFNAGTLRQRVHALLARDRT
jgi:CheY-like chemotaxis protein